MWKRKISNRATFCVDEIELMLRARIRKHIPKDGNNFKLVLDPWFTI